MVSIVVPVYNCKEKLQRCFNSLVTQVYSDLEIIFVDDGSTDGSYAVCEQMQKMDARVKVLRQSNQGVSAARNAGLAVACGEWIIFVDSDDWIEPETVDYMLNLIQTEDADIGVYSFANEYGNFTRKLKVEDGVYSPNEVVEQYANFKNADAILCSVCNKMYRRSIITERNVHFAKGIPFGEDYMFNAAILTGVGKIVVSSNTFYHYDCTSENSGVKKLYVDFDKYLLAIGKATQCFADSLRIEKSNFESFYRSFMGQRWDYAISICLESDKSAEECADILCKWITSIPEGITQWTEWKDQTKRWLLEKKCGESLTSAELCRRISKIRNEYKRNRRLLKIKRILKKVVGK